MVERSPILLLLATKALQHMLHKEDASICGCARCDHGYSCYAKLLRCVHNGSMVEVCKRRVGQQDRAQPSSCCHDRFGRRQRSNILQSSSCLDVVTTTGAADGWLTDRAFRQSRGAEGVEFQALHGSKAEEQQRPGERLGSKTCSKQDLGVEGWLSVRRAWALLSKGPRAGTETIGLAESCTCGTTEFTNKLLVTLTLLSRQNLWGPLQKHVP